MRPQRLFLLAWATAVAPLAQAQNISTIAGGDNPIGSLSTAWSAFGPGGVAIDASGNLYIGLADANQVWVVNTSGVITNLIGNGMAGFSGDGGPAASAEFDFYGQGPVGLAVDSSRNLYISDFGNHVIRKVSATTGIISTVAGNGTYGYGGDGGLATDAELSYPRGLAVDSSGDLYISDGENSVIREVSAATGIITTVAGNGVAYRGGDGGPATSAYLNIPEGVAVDSSGNLYIADTDNSVIRKVSGATGIISTVAGDYSGYSGFNGDGVPATSANLDTPFGVAVDSSGNLYIADTYDQRIRKVTAATGIINTVAGNGTHGYSGDGGAAASAALVEPYGVTVDSSGNLYIADLGQFGSEQRVFKVTAATGIISTVAGNGTDRYAGDGGPAASAALGSPSGVAVDSSGNLYIADTDNSVIRKVAAATGTISTVAGNPLAAANNGEGGYSGDGGPAISADLAGPVGVAVDSSGNLYIADTDNGVIRKVAAATGIISTVAGNHTYGYGGDGGPATSAALDSPSGVAVDSSGNLYIADEGNNRIRKVAVATGIISTVAGSGSEGYSGDGGPATSAALDLPSGVAVDSSGNLYIADVRNYEIRRVTAATGIISTVAGNGTPGYSGDGGVATSAELLGFAVAVDSSGNLYIDDSDHNVIRKVAAVTGIISTVAGNDMFGYSGDGGPATSAELAEPESVAVSSAGRVYVADTSNNRIRALPDPTAPAISWPAPASITPGTALSATRLDATATVPGTFVYAPPAGTVLSAGNNQTLSVTFTPADILDYAATAATTTISVTSAVETQIIAFGARSTQIIGNPPFTLNATASSGLAVTLASNSTGVCTVSGTTVTLVGAGTCSITASQPGNSLYASAEPVTVTFTVDPQFGDVSSADESAAFVAAIDEMLSKGITSGCKASPLEYCPGLDVTRGQMAVFIIRAIYGSNNFNYSATPHFSDATPSSVGAFFPYIQKMEELGITSGCTTTTYCPNLNVTRGQMAVFIIRARYGTSFNFDFPSTPYFSDATASSVGAFFKYIQRMKQDNITSGCTLTTYCPNLNVTRDDMAVFMIRGGFNQLLPSTEPIIAIASPATGGLGETINVTLSGVNTNFAQGMTTVSAGAGLTVGTVTVNSPTSLTVPLTIAANATPDPASLLVETPVTGGPEEAVLPNGFTITTDPAVGVVAYWTGNGTTVDVESGLSGTLTNGATYASATSRTQGLPDAQAFSLNGTNSYVQAASGETVTLSGARTLATWVYPNASTGLGMPIITGGSTLAAGDIFGITGTTGTCSGGQYQLYVDHGGICYVSDISLAPSIWSLVAATFDGTNAVFFIDGVASVAVPAQMFSYGVSTYEIGGNTLGGASSGASFNGLLSEVQVYGRALTPAEIQGIYAP